MEAKDGQTWSRGGRGGRDGRAAEGSHIARSLRVPPRHHHSTTHRVLGSRYDILHILWRLFLLSTAPETAWLILQQKGTELLTGRLAVAFNRASVLTLVGKRFLHTPLARSHDTRRLNARCDLVDLHVALA